MPSEVVALPELAPGELHAVVAGGLKLLVCRVDDALYAIENRCPHAEVPMTRGKLAGCLLECPFHGGKIDVRTGQPAGPPIRRPVETFEVRRVEGGVEIQL